MCPDDDRGVIDCSGGGDPKRVTAVSNTPFDECDAARHVLAVRRPYAEHDPPGPGTGGLGDRHFAVRGIRGRVSADVTDPKVALDGALAAIDGHPGCTVCPSSADFFLYEAGRVEKFVCWEHVSPVSAAVDAESGDELDRPMAIRLD